MNPDVYRDTVLLPKNIPSAATPSFNRPRRFSVDAFSPRKRFSSKRGSESAIETGQETLRGQSLPGYGSRAPKQTFKVTFKQPCRFLYQRYRRYHHRDQDESFILLTLDNDNKVVISCPDARNSQRALANMMVPNVRSCRLISPSVKATMSRKAHSCEGLAEVGGHERVDHIPDHRRRLVSDMVVAEELYCQQLRMILQSYVQELSKRPALSDVIWNSLSDVVAALLSQSALLVQNLRCVLETWDNGSWRIGHYFTSTFWNSCLEYKTWYRENFRLLCERQQTDATLREFLQGRQLQGIPSWEKLLNLPRTVFEGMEGEAGVDQHEV